MSEAKVSDAGTVVIATARLADDGRIEIDLGTPIPAGAACRLAMRSEEDGRYKDAEGWRDAPFTIAAERVDDAADRVRFPEIYGRSVVKGSRLRLEIPDVGYVGSLTWPLEIYDRAIPTGRPPVDLLNAFLDEVAKAEPLAPAANDNPSAGLAASSNSPPTTAPATAVRPRLPTYLLLAIAVIAGATAGYVASRQLTASADFADKEELTKQADLLRAQQNTLALDRTAFDKRRSEIERELENGRDKLAVERATVERLQAEVNALLAALPIDQQKLAAERQALDAGRQKLTVERQNLESERQRLSTERQGVAAERLRLASEQQTLSADRQKLSLDRQALDVERQRALAASQSLERERQKLVADQQNLAAEQSKVAQAWEEINRARHADETATGETQTAGAQCDQRAANPNDPRKPAGVPGVPYPQLVASAQAAITICDQAAGIFPTEPRYQYQLARALQAARTSAQDDARIFQLLEHLKVTRYPAAFDNLGWMYINARQDLATATRLFRTGVSLGDPDAMISLADLLVTGRVQSGSWNEAYSLYQRASQLGHRGAAEVMQKFEAARQSQPMMPQMFNEVLKGIVRQ